VVVYGSTCRAGPVHVMKTYGEVEKGLHKFLTLILDGGEWSASGVCVYVCMLEDNIEMDQRMCLEA
jgi:hypothetical protein